MTVNNKITLIALAAFLLSASIFWFGILPQQSGISELNKSLIEKKADFERKEQLAQDAKNLKKSYAEIDDAGKEKLKRVLPKEENVIDYLPEIEAMFTQNGLGISYINFESFSGDKKSAEKKIPKFISGEANPVKVSIEAKGSYESFKNFLTNIEWDERLTDIVSIKFSTETKTINAEEAVSESPKYTFTIEAFAYWMP